VGIAQSKSVKYHQSDRVRINNDIRVKDVRVIDPDGNQIGILPIREALAAASQYGLDLVEVSPMAKPPVCKIMDYGRYKYEQTKKQQEAKKKANDFSAQGNQGAAQNR
jgi:translation initiation factor IF-3